MSVVYETRPYIHDTSYPPVDETQDADVASGSVHGFDDTDVPDMAAVAAVAASFNAREAVALAAESEPPAELIARLAEAKVEDTPGSRIPPIRARPIPKPGREVQKDANGMFLCTWPSCAEEHKEFSRKCEWKYVQTSPSLGTDGNGSANQA